MVEDFDITAQNLAEGIDAILTTERSRDRRVALIRQQVKRALSLGFRAGKGQFSKRTAADLGDR